MDVLLNHPAVTSEDRAIPFWEEIVRSGRIVDDEAQLQWLDDVEQRLREILALIDPRPAIEGYCIVRSLDGVTIYTVTGSQVGKREIGLLSAGAWPCWEQIVERVPEFQGTAVVFDAVARHEWLRSWNIRLQRDRMWVEYGVF